MTRKTLIFLSIFLGCIVLGLTGYYFFIKQSSKSRSLFSAIPPDAGMLLLVKDPFKETDQLFKKEFWNNIDTVGAIPKFIQNVYFLDSLISTNEKTNELIHTSELVMAFYNRPAEMEVLFVLGIKNNVSEHFLDQFIQKANKNSKIEKIKSEFGTIRSIRTINGDSRFCFALKNGLFISSLSYNLVEASIQQLDSDKNWISDRSFNYVRKSTGENEKITCYFRMDLFSQMLQPYLTSDNDSLLINIGNLGNWAGGVISMEDDAIKIKGTLWTDSSKFFFHKLKKLNYPDKKIATYLPSNTLMFIEYCWNEEINQNIKSQHNQISDEPYFDWTYQQRSRICFFISGGRNESVSRMCLIDYNEIDTQWEKLVFHSSDTVDTFSINGFPVAIVTNDVSLKNLPFSFFDQSDSLYVCKIEEYFIISHNLQGIENYTGKYISSQTLENQTFYLDWEKKMPEKRALTFYFRPNLSLDNLGQSMNEKGVSFLKAYKSVFLFSESAGVLFYPKANNYGFELKINFTSTLNEDLSTVWQLEADRKLISQPFLFSPKNDSVSYILFQDSANILYASTIDGQLLWKRNLDSRVTRNNYTVNFYEPESQFLFATESFIYLIDKMGKNLPGFPLEIPGGTKNSILYLNTGGEDGHRILSISNELKIYNWDKNGNPAEGWSIPKINSEIIGDIEYINTSGVYLYLLLQNDGLISLINKQGKLIDQIETGTDKFTGKTVWVKNQTLSTSALVFSDDMGNCHIRYLDKSKNEDVYSTIDNAELFAYLDSDGDGKKSFFVSDGQKIISMDRDNKTRSIYNLPDSSSELPLHFQINGKYYFIVPSIKEGKLFLLNSELTLVQGFPVTGTISSNIYSKDDDLSIYLITSFLNKVLCYQINFVE